MRFNSISFAAFFFFAATLSFIVPSRARNAVLLAASYFFYIYWSAAYITVILAITLIDYCAALQIERATGRNRKLYLALSILCNLGLLVVFKYANFFGAVVSWLLPLGISFHTFQAISYTCDVYRGEVKAERILITYALYVAFFPQLVAGPIERAGHLLPQLHHSRPFDPARLISGLKTIAWGLIKKSVIADLAAPAVNIVYAHPRDFSSPLLCLATILFAVQIYCDFSGYCDIATGAARILGYDLTLNFRTPYFARSIPEFWRRWHISLSTWFRDYLYIPLGGNRVSRSRRVANIAVVFLLSGLWHGAHITFIAWGALHALFFLAAPHLPVRASLPARVAQVLLTSLQVTLGWIFFRAASLPDALYILTHLAGSGSFHRADLLRLGLPRFELAFLLLAVPAFFLCEYLSDAPPALLNRVWQYRSVRWPAYATAFYTVVFFGIFQHLDFIYFQF